MGRRRLGTGLALADHNAAIMSAVLLLIGAKLVGDAIAGLG